MPSETAHQRLDRSLRIEGATCACSVWEPPGGSGASADVILVHGAAANRHWWSHIVPMISGARVITIDLWGHGDSETRATYTLDDWAAEVTEVARRCCAPRPYLVGHSVGGLIAVHAAQTDPDAIGAAMALDTVLRRTDEAVLASRRRTAGRPARTYESVDGAVAEFVRRHPAASFIDEDLLVEIGLRSHRRVGGRWQRAFDPRVFGRPEVAEDFLRPPAVPTRWVRAGRGNIDDAMARQIRSRLGAVGSLLEVPGVGHQLILEQPGTCGSLINDFLAWAPTARESDAVEFTRSG